ncbi:hypothetical protein DFP72DRAFT_1124508 [Ephemerocybe angulata]|uniref:F-box domain-containing protein n=1 Tax=Ephemerocybe angulata TaxID=980116 RepID=A0A8H6HYQ3_9AGAR|nr:hypothetical protein DFP72DRAFT_1124508 [Tulosesus angulatus]
MASPSHSGLKMASTSLSGLPEELKRMVLSFCDAPALESVSRTSTAFHSEAERLLYGTISLHHCRPQSFACLKTLALNKAKANLVRTLAVTLPDEYNDPPESEDKSTTGGEAAVPVAEFRAQDLEPVAGKELASESESVSDDGSMQDESRLGDQAKRASQRHRASPEINSFYRARAAWPELTMLFRTLVAQGFRPQSLEIMAPDPEDAHPSQIMGAQEIEHGAHMLADVLNDRLVLQWTDTLANVQFLGKNLSYKVARDQSIKWHS